MRWTCYQQNTATLDDSNTGHGHQSWLRHPPIHSWMHHYLPLFPESAYSKSFLASLALLLRIASRCITVHKQRKRGHKLPPRCDLRQEHSQRAVLSDRREAYCLKSKARSFVVGQLWLWLPKAQRREFPCTKCESIFALLKTIPTFLILTFTAGGSCTNPSVALAYCILFEIPHRGICRHRHPINRILISM